MVFEMICLTATAESQQLRVGSVEAQSEGKHGQHVDDSEMSGCGPVGVGCSQRSCSLDPLYIAYNISLLSTKLGIGIELSIQLYGASKLFYYIYGYLTNHMPPPLLEFVTDENEVTCTCNMYM